MGIRGELFTTDVQLKNRTYFFNVKENRTGDVFLQIVETKNIEGSDFERRTIVIFEEDMRKFLRGFDSSLSFIEKARKNRQKEKAEKRSAAYAERSKDRDGAYGGQPDGARSGRKTPKPKSVRVIPKKRED